MVRNRVGDISLLTPRGKSRSMIPSIREPPSSPPPSLNHVKRKSSAPLPTSSHLPATFPSSSHVSRFRLSLQLVIVVVVIVIGAQLTASNARHLDVSAIRDLFLSFWQRLVRMISTAGSCFSFPYHGSDDGGVVGIIGSDHEKQTSLQINCKSCIAERIGIVFDNVRQRWGEKLNMQRKWNVATM